MFVSELNCFLRSRCSMEMWCPDDIGRDSWDWVGPPAWERACFESPEWGGGSSPVKTEPPQIVLLLLLWLLWFFLTQIDETAMLMSTPLYDLIGIPVPSHLRVNSRGLRHSRGALDDEELFIVEGSKNWRSTPEHSRRSAKNDAKCVKKPIIAAVSKVAGNVVPVCVAQLECPHVTGDERYLRHFHCEKPCRCTTTGTSTILVQSWTPR